MEFPIKCWSVWWEMLVLFVTSSVSSDSTFFAIVSMLRFFPSLSTECLKLSIDRHINSSASLYPECKTRWLFVFKYTIFRDRKKRSYEMQNKLHQMTSPKGWAPTMGLQKWEFSVLPSWFIQLNKYNWNYFKNKPKSSKVDVATDTHTIHVRVTCEQKRGKPIIKWNNRQFEWKYWKYTRSKAVFNRNFLSKLMGLTVISA